MVAIETINNHIHKDFVWEMIEVLTNVSESGQQIAQRVDELAFQYSAMSAQLSF